jgi:hypothetical protein
LWKNHIKGINANAKEMNSQETLYYSGMFVALSSLSMPMMTTGLQNFFTLSHQITHKLSIPSDKTDHTKLCYSEIL